MRAPLRLLCLSLSAGLAACAASANTQVFSRAPNTAMLFDFTKMQSLEGWTEQSDPVRVPGMSKATLTLQKTQVFQRAVFFALLNPQPNGAGFAGVRRVSPIQDLSEYDELQIKCRGQGLHTDFKVVLRHRDENDEPDYSYEQTFAAPEDEFQVVRLPFSEFKAYYRGRPMNDSAPLDTSRISSLGLQFYGGVYLPKKQKGPATLEMDWIQAA